MSKRYEVAKIVLESKSAGKLEGVLLDTFTASALVRLYDALSADSRAKFDAVPLSKLVSVAFGGK